MVHIMFSNIIYVMMCSLQTRSDWYVHTVLYTLPWVGKELFLKKETEFNKILVSIQSYLGKRSRTHLHALKVWTSDSPHLQEDVRICLVFYCILHVIWILSI